MSPRGIYQSKLARQLFFAGGLLTLMMTVVGSVNVFHRWQRQTLKRLQMDSRLISTARGPIEYQTVGSGPAVIYAHGTPGGYDQGLAFARFLCEDRCMFIAPSRPGYLRTPLASGPAPEEQADMYVALLDELGIEKASVIGFSGGGPSALQFALRYPERCRSLIMIGGIVQPTDLVAHKQVLPFWQRLSTELVERLLISDHFLYVIHPIARLLPDGEAVVGMLDSGALYPLRKAGYENDLQQFAAMSAYDLERIRVPTLVVHGKTDEEVPFSDAQLLADKVADATLLALQGDHSSFYTYARTMKPLVRHFLLDI